MDKTLRFNVADQRITYTGKKDVHAFSEDRIWEFNHRHAAVLRNYDLHLETGTAYVLADAINTRSNLGAMRNRQLREATILAAALPAIAVGLHGCGSLNRHPKETVTRDLKNHLKRANDRTSALVMGDVLQTTTETLPVGEEVLIASALTEGVRVKPGKEAGGNPTIAVGALFGKKEHRARYGLPMPRSVSLLSMGNDVIDGTTKSITGTHSSLTALFLTESNVKRHIPDIYVQRWMGGAHFEEFDPRQARLLDAAEIIAHSYGYSSVDKLTAYFLDRNRHIPAMDTLNEANICTPFDKDGDLFPALILGLEGVDFPNGRALNSMVGEIGGSAEWAVGVLPLVWRGGQAMGMLTSQSSLTRSDLSPEEKWKERFHFTEEEFMLVQDARFEQKPYFSIRDILEDPFAGGISAFGAITDNYFLPFMKGVRADAEKGTVSVFVLAINSLGVIDVWELGFKCNTSLEHTETLMTPPKEKLQGLVGKELESAIRDMLEQERSRRLYRLFFYNEYYPAMIPVRDKIVMLPKAIDGLIERGALSETDREIVAVTQRLAGEWFANHE